VEEGVLMVEPLMASGGVLPLPLPTELVAELSVVVLAPESLG